MAADVVPALQESIQTEFNSRMVADRRVRAITNRIRDGTATFTEGREYAERAGVNLSKTLSNNLRPENLPDGKLYYNIANRTINRGLKRNYDIVNQTAAEIQAAQDALKDIGINAVKADYPTERIAGLIDKITENGITPEKILYWLGEPIINNSEAFFDDFIKDNADFRQQAGLKATISRILAPGCCAWCAEVAGRGTYVYGDQPDDFFSRHEFCRCTVTYQSNKTSQNVWTKRTWASTPQEIKRRESINPTAKTGISAEELKQVEAVLQRDRDIAAYMRATGYSRRTARQQTLNKTRREINEEIQKEAQRIARIT